MTVMPAALAAAMPVTPQEPTAQAPSQVVATMPTVIAPTGYQVGRPAEK